ncbi:hypothetical protein OG21DRAFT_1485810 [Imleria badia]|nr:hypothetical protein OG21DRAFT_1485810 [Imleria badia]
MNIRFINDTHGYPSRDDTPADILSYDTEKEYHNQCYAFFAAVFKVLRTVLEKNQPNWFEDVCKIGSPTRIAFFVDLENEYSNVRDVIRTVYTGSRIMKKYYSEMVSSKSFPRAKDNEPRVVIVLDEAHVLHETYAGLFSQADVLLQTIKEYSEDNDHAVWVVFASTTFKVTHFSSLEALCA